MQKLFCSILFIFFLICETPKSQLPEGFVYVKDNIPTIELEMRYFGTNNFLGVKVDGYEAETCILSKPATVALKNVQNELRKKGLGLKIFDAYRPQRAVDHFQRWARKLDDTLTKQQFYPNVAKKDLFKLQYIAAKSRHSSGSTVDVTIIDLHTKKELDMGSSYDFFGKISWVAYEDLTKIQLQNRALLQETMLNNGFRNYPQEWWHFTLVGEPYKNQYFDFPIK